MISFSNFIAPSFQEIQIWLPLTMGAFQVFLLTALTLQTAANVILIKYAFSREGPKIHSAVLVLYIEVVKLVLSLAAYLFENGSCGECFRGMCRKVCDGTSFLRCAGLSLMYVAQNNTAYLALKHMNAALFQVNTICLIKCRNALIRHPLQINAHSRLEVSK